MRRFLINVIIFSAILLVINLILAYYGNKIYFGKYQNHSLDYRSYILCDSHGEPLNQETTKYGIYNFSAGSDSYIDMKRKLNYLISKTSVDTIYISVDEHTLSPYREKTNNQDRSTYYATYADYDNAFQYARAKIVQQLAFFQPKQRTLLKKYFGKQIESIFKKEKKQTPKSKPSTPTPPKKPRKPKTWADKTDEQRTESINTRYGSQFPNMHPSAELEQALQSIIAICKKEDIVLIGIKFPLTQGYIKKLGTRTFGASKILEAHGLTVLDFQAKYPGLLERYRDQDHLNDAGGVIFVKEWLGE